MSTDLAIRYSDVMQAERDFNNLARSSTTNSDCSDSTLSVRDARNRFEQMSSSIATAAPSSRRSEGDSSKGATPVRPPPPNPTKPLKKRLSEPVLRSQSTCASPRVQSSSNQKSVAPQETEVSAHDVGGKTKAKSSKPSLKKVHSVRPSDLASTSSKGNSSTTSSSDNKQSTSTTKKFFRRMSSDKGKVDSTSNSAASNGSAKGRTPKNGEASSQNSSTTTASPTHKKFSSPLALKKKSPSASSSTSSQPSPLADKPGSIRKSFSNTVLASTEERSVQASLKEEDGGKVVGGTKPTAPRVIKDGELNLNLSEDLCLSGAELKSVLNKQLAYISGGVESGHLILTFPDVGLKHLENSQNFDELMTTIIYFKSLVSIQQLSAGFTLILDAHSSKTHTSVKQILERAAQSDFPLNVHMVCIIVKTGLFGRSKNLASPDVCAKLHLATLR